MRAGKIERCPPDSHDRKAEVAIGIGCKKGCSSEAIVSLVKRAMMAGCCTGAAGRLFSLEAKRGEAGLAQAAKLLGLPITFLDFEVLQQASPQASTSSPKVMELYGLPSIAEAAALAGAGPSSVLLVARMSSGGASCAIAGRKEP